MKSLSREEMKNIFGGVADSPSRKCKTGACTSVHITADGTVLTETGFCDQLQSGNSFACYCSANRGTVTSNNGVSRCWL